MAHDSLKEDTIQISKLVFGSTQITANPARVKAGAKEDKRQGYGTDQSYPWINNVEDIEGEEELHAVPKNLTHGFAVEEVDSPHVTGYPADDLARHHFVQVCEGFVNKGEIKVSSHNPQYILT